jgi:hypothetical protein
MMKSDVFAKCHSRNYAQAILSVIDSLCEYPKVSARDVHEVDAGPRIQQPSSGGAIEAINTKEAQFFKVHVPGPLKHLFGGAPISSGNASVKHRPVGTTGLLADKYVSGSVFETLPHLTGFFRECLYDIDPNLKFTIIAVERTFNAGRKEAVGILFSSNKSKKPEVATSRSSIVDAAFRRFEQSPEFFSVRIPPTYESDRQQAFFLLRIPFEQWSKFQKISPRPDLRGLCMSYIEAFLWVLFYQVVNAGLVGISDGCKSHPTATF